LLPASEQQTEDSETAAQLIGYSFARPELLAEALTHPSATGEQPRRRGRRGWSQKPTYERLEFLGDRVLGLVIAEWLWRRFETEREGHLTRRFAQLVKRDTLAAVAATIGLDRHLNLSRGEANFGTHRKASVLADVCEAVIAAIYIDGGIEAARDFIRRWWEPLIAEMEKPPRDPKAALQEWAQGRGMGLPVYEVRETSGPAHALRFTVSVRVADFEEATAAASSKRAAEALAAAALLQRVAPKVAANAS